MNSSLKLFTQSDILHQIGVGPLHRFLSHFTDSDPQLCFLNADSPYFCSELARLFTQPQSLSPRLCETLVLLETAALPKHHDRLSALAQQRLPDLYVTEFHPLALALELWLAFPDDLSQFAGSAARAASGKNLPPNEQPNDHAAPTELFESVNIPSARCQNVEALSPPPIQESTNPSIHPSAPSAPIQQSANGASSIEHPASAQTNEQSFVEPSANCAPSPQGEGWGEGDSDHLLPQTEPTRDQSALPPILESTNPVSSIENPASDRSCILDSLRSLLTRYVILPEHAAEALALWIVHTYAFELRDVTTYLGLESPVRRCGKSTLLNVLSRLVNRPLVAANVSPSALYRAIEELRPTLMIDEADTFLKPNDELTGILNAGYHRATAYVLRVSSERISKSSSSSISNSEPNSAPDESTNEHVAPTELEERLRSGGYRHVAPMELLRSRNGSNACAKEKDARVAPDRVGPRLVRFSCWCPKVIARIGRLPETLADRCIVIRMQRKTPNDQCERLRDLDMVAIRKDLPQQCAQFVQDHRDAIISAKPAIPAALNDRAADIWEPLLALADCAGGDWPALARGAALALSSDTRENNPIGSLLLDIFILFAASGQDRIPTRALVEALNTQFTDRPWMETRKGQRSTEMWLSEQLRPFGIKARTFRSQDSILRGYHRDDFGEAFRRYIPQSETDIFRALGEKNVAQATPAGPPAS